MNNGWRFFGLVALALAACDAAVDVSSASLRDAGDWLADAGAELADAGDRLGARADAQEPGAAAPTFETFNVACTKEYSLTQTITASGASTKEVHLYAEVELDTRDIKAVTAMQCDLVQPRRPEPRCDPGSTCTGTFADADFGCSAAFGADLGDGKIRVLCGVGNARDGQDVSWQYLWKSARIVVLR